MRSTLARPVPALALALVLAACGGGGGGEPPAFDGSSFPAGVRAFGPPPFSCGPSGPATQAVMQDLNRFWQSSVTSCACQGDAPATCSGGGFVFNDPGYVYFDGVALNRLDTVTGSQLPADMVMAHEFGHTLQLWLQLPSVGKGRELQADCLAGFYVGSRVRRGLATQADVASTFATACTYGDPYLAPWYEPGAHGVCQERVAALNRGISGNLSGVLPGVACS